jgi:tetraprenyl-beta-curcumene synthase
VDEREARKIPMTPETAVLHTRATRTTRGASARLFASAASRYWLGVFPAAHGAKRRLLERAESIPDPLLRAAALDSHRDKGANSEGLAALAVLAPAENRTDVARSLVAYQLMLDYLDGVSEAPSADPMANGLRLHCAFEVALDPSAEHDDYYAYSTVKEDGGYLRELIETCRAPLANLPSYEAARPRLLRQALLCCESQALNHALHCVSLQDQLDEWAARTAAESGLEPGFEWWELIAAAAASSLCVGALLALAATPGATEADAQRVEAAYFPWATGLNGLLDSLVDIDEDPEDASHLRRYQSYEQAADRLQALAAGARRRVSELPDGRLHEAILAAMGALYLIHEEAWCPDREPISLAVYAALGPLAKPSIAVHLLRRRGRGGRALLAARRSRARLRPDGFVK